jgi:hypothetical protein
LPQPCWETRWVLLALDRLGASSTGPSPLTSASVVLAIVHPGSIDLDAVIDAWACEAPRITSVTPAIIKPFMGAPFE